MTAEILSIGDEILIGQIVNTNAAWLGDVLSAEGIRVVRQTTVGDDPGAIRSAFDRAWRDHDVVVSTGGLGPTTDDRTRDVVVEYFGTELVFNPAVYAGIERQLAALRRTATELHRDQAMVPASAHILPNAHGTAPGYHFTDGTKHFFVTPGVPYEMQGMVTDHVLPVLRAGRSETRASRTLVTTGIPESLLAARIAPALDDLAGVELAYLPSPLGVRLRVTAWDADADRAQQRVDDACARFVDRIRQYVFGEGDATLERAVGELLRGRGATIAVAESCTGGLVADLLTNVPGSSDYFLSGAVAYADAAKIAALGVPAGTIARHGAVSRETALAMAEGARTRVGSTFGLSTTGIAGPSGGSADKPVGLVWIGLATPDSTEAFSALFGTDRRRVKIRAAQAALDVLRRHLAGLPLRPATAPDGKTA